MAASLAEAAYGGTSIAEIARLAKVSNSTVYALFKDKESIFVALYEQLNAELRSVVDEAVERAREANERWPVQLRAGIDAYLRTMIAGGRLSWCLLVEATSISAQTRAARRAAFELYGDMLVGYANRVAQDDGLRLFLSSELVVAAIGGMNELLLREMETQTGDVDALVDAATQLFTTLFEASWERAA